MTRACSSAARVTSVGDLPTSAASADSAVQLVPEKAISVCGKRVLREQPPLYNTVRQRHGYSLFY